MSLQEAQKLALKILKNVMEDKISKENVEVALVTVQDRKFRVLPSEAVEQILTSLA